jgi:hypothetical protein
LTLLLLLTLSLVVDTSYIDTSSVSNLIILEDLLEDGDKEDSTIDGYVKSPS